MADPAWFLSTLAQSIAAIVGFAIALALGIFQIERRRKQKRTDAVREELIDLRADYNSPLSSVKSLFSKILREVDDPYTKSRDKFMNGQISNSELKNMILEDQSFKLPYTYLIYCHSSRVNSIIYDIEESSDPTEHYLLSENEIDMIKSSSDLVSSALLAGSSSNEGWPDNGTEELYNEINNELDVSPGDSPSGVNDPFQAALEHEIEQMEDDIPDETIDNLRNTFNSHITSPIFHQDRFSSNTSSIKDFLMDKYGSDSFEGNNFVSIGNVFDELGRDIEKIDVIHRDTILYQSVNIKRILAVLTLLLILGVVVPIASLIPAPVDLFIFDIASNNIIGYQILLLAAVSLTTTYLMYLLFENSSEILTN